MTALADGKPAPATPPASLPSADVLANAIWEVFCKPQPQTKEDAPNEQAA